MYAENKNLRYSAPSAGHNMLHSFYKPALELRELMLRTPINSSLLSLNGSASAKKFASTSSRSPSSSAPPICTPSPSYSSSLPTASCCSLSLALRWVSRKLSVFGCPYNEPHGFFKYSSMKSKLLFALKTTNQISAFKSFALRKHFLSLEICHDFLSLEICSCFSP